ncbi:MAG: PIG-L family deacetylase [Planctomycetes bacterium]|nr:PIG-L family deacetylase [Planctomycetota bacterium]
MLAFAPHPDDEIAGPGGCLALHRRAGDPVRVVVASTGAAGDPEARFDAATYAARREDESRRGLAEIGVGDAVYWRLPDNCVLSDSDYELGFELATAAIREYRPDVVYLPWEAEGHPDHHALHRIVIEALRRSTFVGLAFGYEVWNAMVPDVVVDITAVAEQKRRGIRAHATQTAYVDFEHTILGLNAYRSMVHARGRGYCEGLRRIAPIAAPPGDAT